MKIHNFYLKVDDLPSASQFWQEFLEITPRKKGADCQEFPLENTCLTLLKNPGDSISDSNAIPVFFCEDEEILDRVQRARELGALVVADYLGDLSLQSIVLEDPSGNEFELSKLPL